VELVNLRLSVCEQKPAPVMARLKAAGTSDIRHKTVVGCSNPVALVQRASLGAQAGLDGPALILETNATTWLAPGWHAHCDDRGNLMLRKSGKPVANYAVFNTRTRRSW
jgi:N-methylhydantoinase A